jgi:hypothetical protein
MMLAYRLVRLIETNSEQLAANGLEALMASDKAPDYKSKVPPEEFKATVGEMYRQLGDWLLGKTEADIEQRYLEIARRRREQGISLPQLIWAIVLTKDNLLAFLKKDVTPEQPLQVSSEIEVLRLLEQFFDRAVYYAAVSYERSGANVAMQR